MKVSYLTEFAACAHYMNMKDAANSLFMAQSSLSKHIKALEDEIGCPLLVYSHNKIHLTPQGVRFLDGIDEIIELHDSMCDSAPSNQRNKSKTRDRHVLVAQQHSCIDLAAGEYYKFFHRFTKQHPEYRLRFAKSSRRTFNEKLADGSIDAFIDYRYGDIGKTIIDYRSKGLVAVPLAHETIGLWCHKLSPLNKSNLIPSDLRDMGIMLPTDVCAPFAKAIKEFGQQFELNLSFRLSASTNQPEYLSNHDENSIYLYPLSFLQTPIITCYDDMVSVPFSDDNIAFDSYILTQLRDRAENRLLVEYMNSQNENRSTTLS